jgi:crotonobetainyl-CoA:carnitine CoA-transferase CaiB-like acyl-CoA transferase
VENYKVGGLAKYKLSYDDLKDANPGLIYCSITGFGQNGPYAGRAGYDYMIQAMGGLMSITGEEDERPGGGPMRVGVAIADLSTGLYSTIAILAALTHRERTGDGQYIDMALLDCATAMLANQGMNYLTTGKAPSRVGNRHPNVVPYQPFETADGHVVIAVGNDSQFAKLCAELALDHLIDDPRYATNSARILRQPELAELLIPPIRQRTSEAWLEAFEKVGVPCGPINDLEDLFNDPQIKHRGMVIEQDHPLAGRISLLASPINLSATPVEYQGAPPTLGQHTDDVLSDILELDPGEIEQLRTGGVV